MAIKIKRPEKLKKVVFSNPDNAPAHTTLIAMIALHFFPDLVQSNHSLFNMTRDKDRRDDDSTSAADEPTG